MGTETNKRLKEKMNKLNQIIASVDFSEINQKLITPTESVKPCVTIVPEEEGAFMLTSLTPDNIFKDVSCPPKMVVLRYGIDKEFAKKLENSQTLQGQFKTSLKKSVTDTLNSITKNNIQLTEEVSMKLPGYDDYVRMRENGDYEIRVCCRLLIND